MMENTGLYYWQLNELQHLYGYSQFRGIPSQLTDNTIYHSFASHH